MATDEPRAALVAAEKVERRLSPYLLAGLRPSEWPALQRDDLSFKAREARVERSLDATGRVVATKTGLVRTVDTSVGLATALQRLRSERAMETLKRGWPAVPTWILCSEAGTPLDLSNVTEAWHRVLTQAKLPGFRLHDPRHTFADELLAQGAPITCRFRTENTGELRTTEPTSDNPRLPARERRPAGEDPAGPS